MLLVHPLVQLLDRAVGQGHERGLSVAGGALRSVAGLTLHAGCWTLQYEEERRQGRANFTFWVSQIIPAAEGRHTHSQGWHFTLFLCVHAGFGATFASPCPVPECLTSMCRAPAGSADPSEVQQEVLHV